MTALHSTTTAIATARRASAPDRQVAITAFEVEVRPLAALRSLTEPWRELIAHAIEPNIFYDPAFALAAAPLLGVDVVVGLVWKSGGPRQLAGLFPMRIERHRYAVPMPVLVAWTHPYAPLGTPLVHRDNAEAVVGAWLDHVAHDKTLPDLVLMRLFDEEGPFAAALTSVLARKGCDAKSFDRYQRALLAPGDNRLRYSERTLAPKRLKEIRRKRRRLEELGTVSVEQVNDGPELARGFDDFLRLEASGWKGRAGTAALNNGKILQFMQQAVRALGSDGKVLMHRLVLDGKAISASITLKSGNTAWGWKIAYDETFSGYSPGMMLLCAVTEALLTDNTIVRTDSCAVSTHSMINRAWGERLAVADCLITAEADAGYSFALASRLEGLRRAAIAAVKSLRAQIWRS